MNNQPPNKPYANVGKQAIEQLANTFKEDEQKEVEQKKNNPKCQRCGEPMPLVKYTCRMGNMEWRDSTFFCHKCLSKVFTEGSATLIVNKSERHPVIRMLKRVMLFVRIVWRPVTGPVPGERWSFKQRHWDVRLSIRNAWTIARTIHAKPPVALVEKIKP